MCRGEDEDALSEDMAKGRDIKNIYAMGKEDKILKIGSLVADGCVDERAGACVGCLYFCGIVRDETFSDGYAVRCSRGSVRKGVISE